MIRVNGEEMEWRPGLTIKDILEAKSYTEPIISPNVSFKNVDEMDTMWTSPAKAGEVHNNWQSIMIRNEKNYGSSSPKVSYKPCAFF